MFNFTSKKSKETQVRWQQEKVALQEQSNEQQMFIGGEQFFNSMRDIGYANEGQAIADIVDNSIEAGATKVSIITERGARDRIESIAIVDNGTGMSPEWLRNSIKFGGTSRENNPDGLGRFGMGLSSAGIAFSELLEVFSRQDENEYYRTWIDVNPESTGYFSDQYLREVLKYAPPLPQKMLLPEWLEKAISKQDTAGKFSGPGTVVILSQFTQSRRKWAYNSFARNLASHLGVIYYKFAGDLLIEIDGEPVEFIDPLFVTPGLRGFDLDEDRAELLGEDTISVNDEQTGEYRGTLTVRYSAMPPTFALKSEAKKLKGGSAIGSNANSRHSIMRDYTGVILSRNGRIIGCDRNSPVRFMNNDYNIGVELSFTGALDNEFGLTTLKNRVSLSESAKKMLQQLGVQKSIQAARKRRAEMFSDWTVKKPDRNKGESSAAEQAASVQRAQARIPVPTEVEESVSAKSKSNTEKEVQRRVSQTGETKQEVEQKLTAQFEKTDVAFEYKNLGKSGNFVEFQEILASKLRVIVNRDHEFFSELFSSSNVSEFGREAMKLILVAFYNSLLRTKINAAESGDFLYDSQTSQHLMRSWSENIAESLSTLGSIMKNDGLSIELDATDQQIAEHELEPS